MNLKITENRAADPEIGFLTKSILKLHGRATAMPTAFEFTRKDLNDFGKKAIKILIRGHISN